MPNLPKDFVGERGYCQPLISDEVIGRGKDESTIRVIFPIFSILAIGIIHDRIIKDHVQNFNREGDGETI